MTISHVDVVRLKRKDGKDGPTYVELTTETGVSGFGGTLMTEQSRELVKLLPPLREILVGKAPLSRELSFEWMWNHLYPDNPLSRYEKGIDPITGESIWNTHRKGRHTPTGLMVTALSAVDNALWDMRGRLSNQPVYRLLGGKREKLRTYLSNVPGDNIAEARKKARELFKQGHTAQKWFFRYGPPDGEEGFAKIVGLVEGVRTDLGEEADLMFDFLVGGRGRYDWDTDYAIRVAKAIQPFKPKWLEEPFSPEEIESYRKLKGETDIPLATGEHTYSRWNIKPFLEEKLVSFVQCDPEWCGGISELLQICNLVADYENVALIPHGDHVLSAAQVVASQPESLCPMVEYGPAWVQERQVAQTRTIAPKAGYLRTPHEPGLGPSIDWNRYERS